MRPQRTSRGAPLEELGALYPGALKRLTQLLGETLDAERAALALVVDDFEDVPRLRMRLTPGGQRGEDTAIERPRARIVSLVLVKPDGPELEIDVAPLEACGLARTHAFTREHAEEHPSHERRLGFAEQGALFGRVEVRKRDVRSNLRQEPTWQRVLLDDAGRVDREAEHARHQLRDLPSRRRPQLRGQRAHDQVGVHQRERGQRHVLHVRVDVLLEPRLVVVGAGLDRDVVREEAMQFAARPPFAELSEREPRKPAGIALRDLARDDVRDRAPHRGDPLVVPLDARLDRLLDPVGLVGGGERGDELGGDAGASTSVIERCRHRALHAATLLAAEGDHREEVPGALVLER